MQAVETISYYDLSEQAQKKIDRYPENPMQSFVFYAKRHGKGYSIHAVQDRQLDHLEAMGGMDSGWRRVIFALDEEDASSQEPMAEE
jgi:hypothetical protein